MIPDPFVSPYGKTKTALVRAIVIVAMIPVFLILLFFVQAVLAAVDTSRFGHTRCAITGSVTKKTTGGNCGTSDVYVYSMNASYCDDSGNLYTNRPVCNMGKVCYVGEDGCNDCTACWWCDDDCREYIYKDTDSLPRPGNYDCLYLKRDPSVVTLKFTVDDVFESYPLNISTVFFVSLGVVLVVESALFYVWMRIFDKENKMREESSLERVRSLIEWRKRFLREREAAAEANGDGPVAVPLITGGKQSDKDLSGAGPLAEPYYITDEAIYYP